MDERLFEHAAAHEADLNERQREVLRLIALGRTNPEIATALGITLDGAKWNVSEVLSKLGFSRREEAAAYYHWQRSPRRRLTRLLRAVATPFALKLAGGAAAVLIVGVAAVLFAVASSEDANSQGEARVGWLLEADVHVENGDRVMDSGLRIAFRDDQNWEYEIESAENSMTVTSNADGIWFYDSGENSYFHQAQPAQDAGSFPTFMPGLGLLVGPIRIASISEVPTLLQALGENLGAVGSVREEGTMEVLGRTCQVFVFGPIWGSESRSYPSGPSTSESGGEARVCVDPETLMALAYEADEQLPDGQLVRVELRRLEFDVLPPGAVFAFTPPAGARSGQESDSAPGRSGIATPVPPPTRTGIP